MLRLAGPVAVAVNVTVLLSAVAASVFAPATAPSVQLTLAVPVMSLVTVADDTPAIDPPPDCTAKVIAVPLEERLP